MAEIKARTLLVVCGETSGEAHASEVVAHLRRLTPEAEWNVFGSGGEKLKKQGARIMVDVSRLSAIGPGAALANLKHYLSLRRQILREAVTKRPDLALLVDFPEFNLPLARKLKRLEIPVCYFISPQIWAWRQARIRKIQRYVDLMLVIFPFEEAFYQRHGVRAVYVGNPTAAKIASLRKERKFPAARKDGGLTVALLPGSRKKEVVQILPVELEAVAFACREVQFDVEVFRAPEIDRDYLEEMINRLTPRSSLKVEIVDSDPRRLALADCALVKSGTSTLEAMLLGVPFAMLYRLPLLSYLLLRPFVRTSTFCLANLVAQRELVPEYIQGNATGQKLGAYIVNILRDKQARMKQKEAFAEVQRKLGEENADIRAAREIKKTFFDPLSE